MIPVSGIADERLFQWGVVIGASLVAAFGDIKTQRVPNALTFPLAAAGLIWAGWRGGVAGAAEAAGACVLLALPYVFLFIFAGGGAGDAKLMGAIGTWLGLKQSVAVLFCVATAGILLAVARAISQRRLKFVLTSVLISIYTFLVCVAGGRRPSPAEERPVCSVPVRASDETPDSVTTNGGLNVPYGVAIALGVCAAAAIVRLWGVEWLW
ncbi:MAG: A24 family peptidase [Planctomycetota bacterium]